MADAQEKLVYFQAMTGLEDNDLCTDILAAHDWDLELAVSAFTGGNPSEPDVLSPIRAATDSSGGATHRSFDDRGIPRPDSASLVSMAPNLAWRLVTLPISVVSGGLGLVSGAIGLGFWVAGGVLSYSLGMLGFGSGRPGESSARPPVAVTPAALEAAEFVAAFEREYGGSTGPNFVSEGFMDALQRSRQDYKLLFVYLHSPDHQDTPAFCERTLCNEVLAAFVNENFVAWGGSIRSSEGFKMSNSLRASRFPFCGVVMAATNQRIALLQQVEGPRSPDEVLTALQRVLEENGPSLAAARIEADERRNNALIREEQDAAYRAALEADRARDMRKKEEQEVLEREAAEAERKRKEEEEALERQAREASEREASLARRRQEKALSLGAEPDKAADVTQVLVRFPTGERKERRFHSTSTIQTLYDYVDSLECLNAEDYCLVSSFPRTVYGPEKRSLTLKEAGLHPQAGLFVELNS